MTTQVITPGHVILQQLGGRKFIAMTGSKNFTSDVPVGNEKPYLGMHLAKNSSRANRLKIELNADDTYTMTFWRFEFSKKTFDTKCQNIKVCEGVYYDMMADIFTEVTGLDISF